MDDYGARLYFHKAGIQKQPVYEQIRNSDTYSPQIYEKPFGCWVVDDDSFLGRKAPGFICF
jgi:hypothetical protein